MKSYDFEAKQAGYREPVWNVVDRFAATPRAQRAVMILDTKEALETRELLARGYSPDRLHVVNRSPAEVAVLTRRLRAEGLPDVQTHGCDFFKTAASVGRLDVLSFDGTSNITGEAFRDGKLAAAIALTQPRVLVCVLLAGREGGVVGHVLRKAEECLLLNGYERFTELRASHMGRIMSALTCATSMGWSSHDCVAHVVDVQCGKYQSTAGQPMLWVVARLEPHKPTTTREHVRRIRCSQRVIHLAPGPWCIQALSNPQDRALEQLRESGALVNSGVLWRGDGP